MKLKTLLSGTAFALLSLSLIRGQESFSFKLYMESLANGKKDTLSLGFSANGHDWNDYGFDSTRETPISDFLADTLNRIGAFILPGEGGFGFLEPSDVLFFKERTAKWNANLTIIVPNPALPVRLTWDSSLFLGKWALLTDLNPGGWPDSYPSLSEPIEIWMDKSSSGLLESKWTNDDNDREYYHVFFPTEAYYHEYHPDSAGMFYVYHKLYVWMKESASNNPQTELEGKVVFRQNPVEDILQWTSPLPLRLWKVYDIFGRIIAQGNDSQTQIDCHDWPAGLYFFEWKYTNGTHGIEKLIKR